MRTRSALAAAVVTVGATLALVLVPMSASASVASHAPSKAATSHVRTNGVQQAGNPLMAYDGLANRHLRNTLASTASCKNACIIASAVPQWACDLEGGVVGAGIAIAFPEASAAWAILGQTGWTVGCDVAFAHYLSSGQVSGLQAYANSHGEWGCFYIWPRNHSTWGIRCTGYTV